jgi:cephalosporin hydroxylase
MSPYGRNTFLVGGATLLLFLAVIGAFVAGANPQSRHAVFDAITGGRPDDAFSSLDDRNTMQFAQVRTTEILEAKDQRLSVAQQKQLLGLWHSLGIWDNMWFLGVRIKKNPMDLWMMQQIISEVKPDFIVETGTDHGGSALYWAAILDLHGLEDARVITIDIDDRTEAVSGLHLWQDYVEFIHSSSTDESTVDQIGRRVAGKKVIVTLDSNHQAHHVLQELRMYGPLVNPGSYLIVEDTNIDGVPVAPDFGPGPMSGLLEYLSTGGEALYEQDLSREVYVLTFNPGGWLRRKAE